MPRLSEMNAQNFANLLWGFAKLNYQPAALLPHISEALLAPGCKPVPAYTLTVVRGGHCWQVSHRFSDWRELDVIIASKLPPGCPRPALPSRMPWRSSRLTAYRQFALNTYLQAMLRLVAPLPAARRASSRPPAGCGPAPMPTPSSRRRCRPRWRKPTGRRTSWRRLSEGAPLATRRRRRRHAAAWPLRRTTRLLVPAAAPVTERATPGSPRRSGKASSTRRRVPSCPRRYHPGCDRHRSPPRPRSRGRETFISEGLSSTKGRYISVENTCAAEPLSPFSKGRELVCNSS